MQNLKVRSRIEKANDNFMTLPLSFLILIFAMSIFAV